MLCRTHAHDACTHECTRVHATLARTQSRQTGPRHTFDSALQVRHAERWRTVFQRAEWCDNPMLIILPGALQFALRQCHRKHTLHSFIRSVGTGRHPAWRCHSLQHDAHRTLLVGHHRQASYGALLPLRLGLSVHSCSSCMPVLVPVCASCQRNCFAQPQVRSIQKANAEGE